MPTLAQRESLIDNPKESRTSVPLYMARETGLGDL